MLSSRIIARIHLFETAFPGEFQCGLKAVRVILDSVRLLFTPSFVKVSYPAEEKQEGRTRGRTFRT
jgi:hypothetical protein